MKETRSRSRSLNQYSLQMKTHQEATNAPPGPGKNTLTEILSGASSQSSSAAPSGPHDDEAIVSMSQGPRERIAALFGQRSERPENAVAGVQCHEVAGERDPEQIHASAERGISTAAEPLPHAARIQQLFGRHDISDVKAHSSIGAANTAREMGAKAYATGEHVVLGDNASLHTVAHEVAHVVQQRGGVQLKANIGVVGDRYERHADAVADMIVQGKSAESLLDEYAPAGGAPSARPMAVQRTGDPPTKRVKLDRSRFTGSGPTTSTTTTTTTTTPTTGQSGLSPTPIGNEQEGVADQGQTIPTATDDTQIGQPSPPSAQHNSTAAAPKVATIPIGEQEKIADHKPRWISTRGNQARSKTPAKTNLPPAQEPKTRIISLAGIKRSTEGSSSSVTTTSASSQGRFAPQRNDKPRPITPSRTPSRRNFPAGEPTPITSNMDFNNARSLELENLSAIALARAGYEIEQNPYGPEDGTQGQKRPDYQIEGELFDNYSPYTKSLETIWTVVDAKVRSEQAKRIVLTLDDCGITENRIMQYFNRNPVRGLEQLLVVYNYDKYVNNLEIDLIPQRG